MKIAMIGALFFWMLCGLAMSAYDVETKKYGWAVAQFGVFLLALVTMAIVLVKL